VRFTSAARIDQELIESMVRFLNFRGSTVSGSAFTPPLPRPGSEVYFCASFLAQTKQER
jgi:hypothetical protein